MEKAYAMVIEEYGKELVRHEFDIPQPVGGEVIIRILASGICGSDVHVWKGQDKRSHLPQILGHEGIGYVQAVNPGRKDIFGRELREGDLVVWDRGVMCKSCYECLIKRKDYNCKSRWTYGFSKSIYDYPNLNGSYSSHMRLVPETDILQLIPREKLKEDEDYIPFVSACCAGTTTACAFEQSRVESGDTVLIQGPGPLGVYSVLYARERGASKIIVVGGTKSRLELCREAGADVVIDRNETTAEQRLAQVLDLTDGRGADSVFEVAGTASAVEEGVHYVATGGEYISAGIAVDVGDVRLNWFSDVARKNATIKGIWVGDIKNTYQAIELYRRHKYILDRTITHRIPLENATEALRMMERREGMKIVLIP